MTLKELQLQVHTLAQAKGWWPPERDPDEVFALMHSEASEALEEWRTGKPITRMRVGEKAITYATEDIADWPAYMHFAAQGHKPEGFFVELADLVIRIADATQAWGMEFHLEVDELSSNPLLVPRLMFKLHGYVNDAWAAFADADKEEAETCLGLAVDYCFFFAKQHNVDLFQVIHLKHAFNATRPTRHGRIA